MIATVALCGHIQFSTMDHYFPTSCYIDKVMVLDPSASEFWWSLHSKRMCCYCNIIITSCRAQAMM